MMTHSSLAFFESGQAQQILLLGFWEDGSSLPVVLADVVADVVAEVVVSVACGGRISFAAVMLVFFYVRTVIKRKEK